MKETFDKKGGKKKNTQIRMERKVERESEITTAAHSEFSPFYLFFKTGKYSEPPRSARARVSD